MTLADLYAYAFQKFRGLLAADQGEDVIILDPRALFGCLRIAFARAHQGDFIVGDLFDGLAEERFDSARVHAIVDHHFVAELQVALEIAADDKRDGVVAPADQLGALLRAIRGQIDRGLDGRVPRADYDDVFAGRSEEHTSELQSRPHLVCRL